MKDAVNKNTDNETKLKDQVCSEIIISGTGFLSSSDADWIAGAATIIVGGIAGLLEKLGHNGITNWLWGLTVWLGFVAVICRANEHRWPWIAPLISGRPGRWAVGAFLVVLTCAAVVQSNAIPSGTRNDLITTVIPQLVGEYGKGSKTGILITAKNSADGSLDVIGAEYRHVYMPIDAEFFGTKMKNLKPIAVHTGPNQTIPREESMWFTINDATSDIDFDKKENDEHFLHCFGCIVYKDSAGQFRSTSYCTIYDEEIGSFRMPQEYFGLNACGKVEDQVSLTIPKRPILTFLRGWISDIEVGKSARFASAFQNDGGTNATKIRRFGKLAFIPIGQATADLAQRLRVQEAEKEYEYDIAADTWMPVAFYTEELDKQAVAQLKGGGQLVFGRIEYSDLGGGEHWLDFCLNFDGKELTTYKHFNESDDNDYGEGGN